MKLKSNLLIPAMFVSLACLAPQRASATVMLSLTTTADLNNLQVGTSVTFDVVLSNLADSSTGDLDALGATLGLSNGLLGTPIISDGGIIPDPLGVLAFDGPDSLDYLYDNLFFLDPITSEGTFFSFTVTPQAVGSGTVEFFAASGANADDSVLVEFNGPLAYRVLSSGGGNVPEPTSGIVWCALACLAAVSRRRA